MTRAVVATCGGERFAMAFEPAAPLASAAVRDLLPLVGNVRHAKWSGEAFWLPLERPLQGVELENATSYPAPGDVLLYRGDGAGVPELLFAYGAVHFRGKAGSMNGIHVLTAIGGIEAVRAIGALTDWRGAQPITLELEST